MNFNFSEDQNAIKELAHQIFTDRTTDEWLLTFAESNESYDTELWNTLAEQGLLGINVPEAYGGTELGLIELCLILEEQGRRVSPLPLFSTCVLGALPMIEFGNDALKQTYLPGVADGSIKLSAAIAEIGMTESAKKDVRISGSSLTGHVQMVPDGAIANAIIVPAQSDAGEIQLVVVDTNAAGVTVTPIDSARGEVQANVAFDNVQIDADKVLGGQAELDWIVSHAELALSAIQVGVCEEAIKRTAEYTTERKQFGAPIGALGMVAMQAADAYIDLQSMRSTYFLALYRVTEKLDARAEVSIAKYQAAECGHRIVHRTQHLHGGMGADVTYPIHRYFLWAKHISVMLGGAQVALTKLGTLLAEDDTTGCNYLQSI
ncbi:MAG: acyl-CoA dehydrogenase family protein [Pseudomonadota bacterium]